MTRITENTIEAFAIELLHKLGYEYIYAPDIAPDSENPERERFSDVLLLNRLQNVVKRINRSIPADAQSEAIKEIQRIASPELLTNNETFHRLLTEGIPVSKRVDGDDRGDRVWLIDFKNPLNNDFVVANQFTIIENGNNKRPDVILFVNGIPLVVIELKNAADENTTIHSVFKQVETYKAIIPSLFTYNGFVVISDGLEAKAGSISSGFSRFMSWKSADGKAEASHLVSQLETLIQGMLTKETLIDLIRHFIVFEKSKKEDAATGITTISTVKKVAAYHQYYAVNRAVESTLRASGYTLPKETPLSMAMEAPESYGVAGVKNQPIGDRKGGVVWHTQGSGKSLSMVFYTGKIVLALDNPTILVITDRNDLDDQLFDTFAASKQLLRQEPVQAEDRNQLKELLKVASGGVVFATVQKLRIAFRQEEYSCNR
jgi:type I restriction enzyme R subunit